MKNARTTPYPTVHISPDKRVWAVNCLYEERLHKRGSSIFSAMPRRRAGSEVRYESARTGLIAIMLGILVLLLP